MRTLGYFLLLFGFLWAGYVPLSVGPLVRAMDTSYRRSHDLAAQQTHSAKDMLSAYIRGAQEFGHLAQLGGIGILLMLAGGVVLDRAARRHATAAKPPLLQKS